MSQINNQTIALAGVLQATSLVDQIARQGRCDEDQFNTAVNSLFVTSPDQTVDVFKSINHIQSGLTLLKDLLSQESRNQAPTWLRYALSILHLEAKLRKQPALLQQISKGLEQANSPKNHFGLAHENTIASLADTYQKTISTMSLRIQVTGEPVHLRSEHNAAKIRTLLFAGIRSAMLWHQVGGRRWQLLFKRKALANSASSLLKGIES